MKILITGGGGFIGSHLVDSFVKEQKHHVWVIDDLSGGKWDNIESPKVAKSTYEVNWEARTHREISSLDGPMVWQADCRNSHDMDYIMGMLKPDVVYHLACNAAENKAQYSPVDITSRNYDAFIKVLKAFIKNKGKRFIFTSSIAVYGALQTPFKETDKPEPEDLYGITKLAAEQTLKVMSKVHGFEYVIARPHNVYGPRQCMTDPYRNVVTIWMNALLKGKPLAIYGDGCQKRCFSYIDDVIEALRKCATEDVSGMTFNVGSDFVYSLNELAANIGKDVVHLPAREQEVAVAISDHTLAKKYLQYNDKTSLKEGLERTLAWCKEQGPQDPVYTPLEIPTDKVPSNWLKPL